MGEITKISWCDHTANPWIGCVEVHEGCDNCYAREMSHRFKKCEWGAFKPRVEVKNFWKKLESFQKKAAEDSVVRSVFTGSMMDIFEKPQPLVDSLGKAVTVTAGDQVCHIDTRAIRELLFEEISNGKYPNLLFLFLTKRPGNIKKYIPAEWKKNPPVNVMFGTTPGLRGEGIKELLEVKGYKFLSIEPLLAELDFDQVDRNISDQIDPEWRDGRRGEPIVSTLEMIDWVIVGGESGPKARPMHPLWVKKIKSQCVEANTPFHFKQWGAWQKINGRGANNTNNETLLLPDGSRPVLSLNPDCVVMRKVGAKKAGHELYGTIVQEFPDHVFKAVAKAHNIHAKQPV